MIFERTYWTSLSDSSLVSLSWLSSRIAYAPKSTERFLSTTVTKKETCPTDPPSKSDLADVSAKGIRLEANIRLYFWMNLKSNLFQLPASEVVNNQNNPGSTVTRRTYVQLPAEITFVETISIRTGSTTERQNSWTVREITLTAFLLSPFVIPSFRDTDLHQSCLQKRAASLFDRLAPTFLEFDTYTPAFRQLLYHYPSQIELFAINLSISLIDWEKALTDTMPFLGTP